MTNITERTILLVEDSDEDFVAVKRALQKAGYKINLQRTKNAEQTVLFLQECRKFGMSNSGKDYPSLILLDLNLPGIDGRELLVQLKRDDRFKEIPVVILTTSNNPRDVLHCYRNGANSYQIKTVGFEKFFNSIQKMISYWFENATLPSTLN